MERKYFYKDSKGLVQKYMYCSRCLTGPYIDTDKDVQVFEVVSGALCLKCMREIGLKGYSDQLLSKSINKIENPKLNKTTPISLKPSLPELENEEPPTEEIVDIEPDQINPEIINDEFESQNHEPEPLPKLKVPFKKSISKIAKPPIPKPEPEESSEEIPSIQFPDFVNMSAREIVDMVFQKTGEKITVCIKSKANIIKHATRILSSKP